MNLSFTPINEAWSVPTYKKNKFKTDVVKELKMFDEENEQETSKYEKSKEIESNEYKIYIKNKELKKYFQPYSNEYIETMIYNLINNNKNDVNNEIIENINTMVIIILVLVTVQLMMKIN